jgi:hypothetical protein
VKAGTATGIWESRTANLGGGLSTASSPEAKAAARNIYELRTTAGLTQAQLGKLNLDRYDCVSVIRRLEDAACEGHQLAMLRSVAGALNQRVEIQFVPIWRSA